MGMCFVAGATGSARASFPGAIVLVLVGLPLSDLLYLSLLLSAAVILFSTVAFPSCFSSLLVPSTSLPLPPLPRPTHPISSRGVDRHRRPRSARARRSSSRTSESNRTGSFARYPTGGYRTGGRAPPARTRPRPSSPRGRALRIRGTRRARALATPRCGFSLPLRVLVDRRRRNSPPGYGPPTIRPRT